MDKELTLRVLASNELADMQEVLAEAQAATNIKLDITYVNTPSGARTVASGDQQYDAVWFDSNAYVALQPQAKRWVATSTKIMSSPVAFGVEPDLAEKLGWDDKAPTWSEIARAAGQQKFRYGMSNPATSTPAFAALANVVTALADTGASIKPEEIDGVAAELRRFFSAQSMTAESAGSLADRFVARAGKSGAPQALISYESTLLALNASGRLKKPLTVVIPADGVISANFPMTLLTAVSKEARAGYRVITDWLRSPDGQRAIMEKTARRPVSGGIQADPAKFGDQPLIELPFPARRPVLKRLLASYLNSTRKVTQSIYVLDLSGSMSGEREEALRTALISLAGGNSRDQLERLCGVPGARDRHSARLLRPGAPAPGDHRAGQQPETGSGPDPLRGERTRCRGQHGYLHRAARGVPARRSPGPEQPRCPHLDRADDRRGAERGDQRGPVPPVLRRAADRGQGGADVHREVRAGRRR